MPLSPKPSVTIAECRVISKNGQFITCCLDGCEHSPTPVEFDRELQKSVSLSRRTRPPCQHQTKLSRTGLINEGVKDLTHGKHFLHPRSGSGKDVSRRFTPADIARGAFLAPTRQRRQSNERRSAENGVIPRSFRLPKATSFRSHSGRSEVENLTRTQLR